MGAQLLHSLGWDSTKHHLFVTESANLAPTDPTESAKTGRFPDIHHLVRRAYEESPVLVQGSQRSLRRRQEELEIRMSMGGPEGKANWAAFGCKEGALRHSS